MASALKCDRCGTLFEKEDKPAFEYTVATDGLFGPLKQDLCPHCAEILNVWFKNPDPVEPKPCECCNKCDSVTHTVTIHHKKRWWEK